MEATARNVGVAVCLALSALPVPTQAETTYYVDPDWGGAATGSAASPWTSLDAAAWVTIDAMLATDDVVVYFSAREASAAEDEQATMGLEILRTDASAHRLTLDGQSQYNANDATPAWQQADGSTKFRITSRYPINTDQGVNRDYVTVRGFRAIAGSDGLGGQIIYYWGGSHVVLEDNDLSHHANAVDGAALQFGYAHLQAGGGNGGNSDITIRRNVVHDTLGECIYVGGSEDTGLPAHQGILIEGNTTYNCGVLGGQGDCVDVKDGSSDVVIRGNHCYGNTPADNVNGITSHSSFLAEDNVIHDTPGKGLSFGTFWGTGLADVVVRRNLIFGNASDGIYLGTEVAERPIAGVTIEHNTIIDNGGNGIVVGAGAAGAVSGVQVNDNLVADNLAEGLSGWGDLGGCMAAHDDVVGNGAAFAGPFAACDGANGNFAEPPALANSSDPPGADGRYFTNDDGLKPLESSPLCGAGQEGDDVGALPCGLLPEPDAGTGGVGGIGAGGAGGSGASGTGASGTGAAGASANSSASASADEAGCGCRVGHARAARAARSGGGRELLGALLALAVGMRSRRRGRPR